MIRIGIHGLDVPKWLEVQEAKSSSSQIGKLKWVGLNIVVAKGGAYHVRPVFPVQYSMCLSNAHDITLIGQSPPGGGGGVIIYTAPILPGWFLFATALTGFWPLLKDFINGG